MMVAAHPMVAEEQRRPNGDGSVDVCSLVKADLEARISEGERKYGQRLTPHNGRDAMMDAYQEVLDLAAYLRQMLYERDGR